MSLIISNKETNYIFSSILWYPRKNAKDEKIIHTIFGLVEFGGGWWISEFFDPRILGHLSRGMMGRQRFDQLSWSDRAVARRR